MKCGFECRQNRKWQVEFITNENNSMEKRYLPSLIFFNFHYKNKVFKKSMHIENFTTSHSYKEYNQNNIRFLFYFRINEYAVQTMKK